MSAGFGSTAPVHGLSAPAIRVLGCLLEKQRTTPDAYPLSLNALRLACNQSTNRDPVVDYDDGVIRDALHRLERSGLVRLASGAGSRAAKYRHLLPDRLPMDPAEQAVMCVLMLRGPQTPGELKQRGERMHSFGQLSEVQDTLTGLIERELVVRQARRPGHKEERYAQLLQDEPDAQDTEHGAFSSAEAHTFASQQNGATITSPSAHPAAAGVEGPAGTVQAIAAELAELTERVGRLERELAELRPSEQSQGPVAAS